MIIVNPILIDNVQFLGEFRSKEVGDAKRVITFRLTVRQEHATLTKALANELRDKIVDQLAADVGATLRGVK